MLYVVCCILYVVPCMLYVVCCLLYVMLYVYVVCCMLYVVCCLLYVVSCILYSARQVEKEKNCGWNPEASRDIQTKSSSGGNLHVGPHPAFKQSKEMEMITSNPSEH